MRLKPVIKLIAGLSQGPHSVCMCCDCYVFGNSICVLSIAFNLCAINWQLSDSCLYVCAFLYVST